MLLESIQGPEESGSAPLRSAQHDTALYNFCVTVHVLIHQYGNSILLFCPSTLTKRTEAKTSGAQQYLIKFLVCWWQKSIGKNENYEPEYKNQQT
jgi:hypothetical protein